MAAETFSDRVDTFSEKIIKEKFGTNICVNKFDTKEVELPFTDPEPITI